MLVRRIIELVVLVGLHQHGSLLQHAAERSSHSRGGLGRTRAAHSGSRRRSSQCRAAAELEEICDVLLHAQLELVGDLARPFVRDPLRDALELARLAALGVAVDPIGIGSKCLQVRVTMTPVTDASARLAIAIPTPLVAERAASPRTVWWKWALLVGGVVLFCAAACWLDGPLCCDDSGAVPDAHVSYLAQRRERRGEWAVRVRMVCGCWSVED